MDFEMAKTIEHYYTSEKAATSIYILFAGLILLCGTIALWRWGLPSSVAKGMLWPIGILTVLTLGSGIIGTFQLAQEVHPSVPKVSEYRQEPEKFLQNEVNRVEEIRKGWVWWRLLWTLFLLVAIGMIFVQPSNLRLGIAIGLMIIGIMGHLGEAFSYERNESYALKIIQAMEGNGGLPRK